MKKTITFALALWVAAMLTIAGCGKQNNSSGSGGTTLFPNISV